MVIKSKERMNGILIECRNWVPPCIPIEEQYRLRNNCLFKQHGTAEVLEQYSCSTGRSSSAGQAIDGQTGGHGGNGWPSVFRLFHRSVVLLIVPSGPAGKTDQVLHQVVNELDHADEAHSQAQAQKASHSG